MSKSVALLLAGLAAIALVTAIAIGRVSPKGGAFLGGSAVVILVFAVLSRTTKGR
jgi:hypothetical protein